MAFQEKWTSEVQKLKGLKNPWIFSKSGALRYKNFEILKKQKFEKLRGTKVRESLTILIFSRIVELWKTKNLKSKKSLIFSKNGYLRNRNWKFCKYKNLKISKFLVFPRKEELWGTQICKYYKHDLFFTK